MEWDAKMALDITVIDAEPCNLVASDKTKKVEDLNFVDGTIFLVELVQS